MDLLKDKTKSLYSRYLVAAFGSAIISSIYSIVDMAMVGKYQGPSGTAALAIVAPIWNIIYSLGLLMGIGGSVIFSTLRGKEKNTNGRDNEYFTASLIGSVILAIISWLVIVFLEDEVLTFFGANKELLPLAKEYLKPIKYVIPLFLFNQMLSAFLRNDNNPNLAMAGVLSGGIFNVFGDYFFVFTCDMGIYGAGLATAIGSAITFLVAISHFFTKKNTLRIAKPEKLISKLGEISTTGFSTFFIDVAMGILTILFNKQIMKYLSADELAIYGPIINISTLVQCCAYSVGQASQPIISINFGAKYFARIKEVLKYAILTSFIISAFWTLLSLITPNLYIKIFMKPTPHILDIAPSIIRRYGISFILLPLNIFSTYYFQAIMKQRTAFMISVFRGTVISGILIMVLPLIAVNALWFTMPITEALVAIYSMLMIHKSIKEFE